MIVIDADVLGRARTGDETYMANLLRELPRVAPDLRFAAVTRHPELVPEGVEPLRLDARSQELRMALALPRLLRRLRPALAHFQYALPLGYTGRSVVTIHDLSFEREKTSMGRVDRATLVDHFARCHAYLVPGVEDFGIAPVEAMAAGKPVVAFRAGGATETVVDGVTGTFFDEPTPAALADAIRALDVLTLDRVAIRAHAETFDTSVFRSRMRALLLANGADPALLAPAEG